MFKLTINNYRFSKNSSVTNFKKGRHCFVPITVDMH